MTNRKMASSLPCCPAARGEEAEQALGGPGAGVAERRLGPTHRGWYSRGYLPHCDHPGLLQSITYRLADSLPAMALERMDAELGGLPPQQRVREQRRRIEEWLDAGHGCCVLRWPEAAGCVVESWQHFAGERYDLIAWVVMPNHVHVLVRVYEGVPLGKVVQSWKSYTGKRIRGMMEEGRAGARRAQDEEGRAGARRAQDEVGRAGARRAQGEAGRAGARRAQDEEGRAGARRAQGEEGRVGTRRAQDEEGRAGARRSQGEEGRAGARRAQDEEGRAGARRSQEDGVWMREYWDRYIRDEDHFVAVVRYIHDNPVKAGLVAVAEDWPWSSAREFAGSAERLLGLPDG